MYSPDENVACPPKHSEQTDVSKLFLFHIHPPLDDFSEFVPGVGCLLGFVLMGCQVLLRHGKVSGWLSASPCLTAWTLDLVVREPTHAHGSLLLDHFPPLFSAEADAIWGPLSGMWTSKHPRSAAPVEVLQTGHLLFVSPLMGPKGSWHYYDVEV